MLMQGERNDDSRVSCQKTAHHSPSLIASSSNEFLLITIAHQRILSESRAQQSSSNLIQSLELGTVTFDRLIVLFAIIACQCVEVMHSDKAHASMDRCPSPFDTIDDERKQNMKNARDHTNSTRSTVEQKHDDDDDDERTEITNYPAKHLQTKATDECMTWSCR